MRLLLLLVLSTACWGAACTMQTINGTDIQNTSPAKLNSNFTCLNNNTPKLFSGSIVPATITGSRFGDFYQNTTTNLTYQCFSTSPPCTAVATNNWVCLNCATGGGGSVFTGSTATAPTFSATPTFSLADVSVKSPVRFEPGALTANVTAVSITNLTRGAKFSIAWLQDGTGGRTVTYGGSVVNTCTVVTTASNITTQMFEVGADGVTINGTGCSTNSTTSEFGGPVRMDDLKTTGSAGSKKVVCVDTTTGQLYASSTGVDCSN